MLENESISSSFELRISSTQSQLFMSSKTNTMRPHDRNNDYSLQVLLNINSSLLRPIYLKCYSENMSFLPSIDFQTVFETNPKIFLQNSYAGLKTIDKPHHL